jgi:hypothetical protein
MNSLYDEGRSIRSVWQSGLEQAHLTGTACGVGQGDKPWPVDGVYEISTIRIGFDDHSSRNETVGFKVSGVGPYQITEPYKVRTLAVRAAAA